MAYFDNAATTYPKPETVYTYMDSFYRANGGSAGRGSYKLAASAKEIIDDTRERIKRLLHCPAKNVVFEPTATIALNIIIQGVIEKGAKNIYITPFEHNAVTRVLHHFEKQHKISVTELAVSNDLEYDLKRIEYQFDSLKPDFVIVSHASNVIGLLAPVESIFALAKKHDAITLVDMAQTAGLVDIDVGLELFDFAVFAGHKTLMGPTGISGFVMNPSIKLEPVLFGGTGYDSANQDMPSTIPERYEMGTLNIVGISGLNSALRWIEENTISYLRDKECENRERLINVLAQYEFITLVGNNNCRDYVGIVSCLFDGISSDSMGPIFDEHNVSVRTGLQCAPRAHKFLNTYPAGTIRFSVSPLTTDKDFDELIKALNYIEGEL